MTPPPWGGSLYVPARLVATGVVSALILTGLPGLAPPGQAQSDPNACVPRFCASSLGMSFVLIPGCEFEMGGESDDPRFGGVEPPHRVWVDDFWMQETEVTVDQFVIGYNEIAREQPAKARAMIAPGPPTDAQISAVPDGAGWRAVVNVHAHGNAITGVTWEGACLFAKWLSRRDGVTYRLPTEAEWEKAAKGTEGLLYSWGNDFDPDKVPAAVARPGRNGPNPFLLYDMTGNAWEWCLDPFDPEYYKTKPRRNPRGPAKSPTGQHAVRGAGGGNLDEAICYSSIFRIGQDAPHDRLGFRLVREATQPASAASAPERPAAPNPAPASAQPRPTRLPREDRR